MKFFGWFLAFAGTLLVALLAPLCMDAALAADELAQSQPLQGQIGGQLLDRTNGLPVPGARVTLYRGSTRVATTTSDSGGSFKFPNQSAGIYYVTIERTGYNSARSDDIVLGPGELSAQVTLALGQSTGGESSPLREIGRVSSSSTLGSGLQSTSTINYTMASQAMLDQNYNSVGDAIGTLPNVNYAGHSSSTGDDQAISLRGFDPSESQTLLDGHPIGPIGVGGGGFSFQVAPYYVLRDTQVVFGAGALGLYGTDATGGVIDMQTLDPTSRPIASVSQGFGNQGKSFSSIQATGTYGQLGYALAGAVQGTYGNFYPQARLQSNLLGLDLSPANVAANTYLVGGAYTLRDGLLKLRWEPIRGTAFTVTGYTANSYDDKSGVGDNDYVPYSLQLSNAQGLVGGQDPVNCPNGIVVTINNAGGTQCDTPQQYASKTYGPSGGGLGPFQERMNQDYHGRMTTTLLGNQQITVDGFTDFYSVNYNRNVAGGRAPNGQFQGGFYSNFFRTNGFLVSDDVVTGNNDFGFGYYTEHQTLSGQEFVPSSLQLVESPSPPISIGTQNFFMREVWTPEPWVSLYANVWYKTLTTTSQSTIDPRGTFIFRPTPRDVIRVIGGRSDGAPSPALAVTSFNSTPGNINPDCGTLVGAGNAVNTDPVVAGNLAAGNLTQETATDFELAYGHSLGGGSNIQVAAYDQHETNLITSINIPAQPGVIPANILSGIFARINTVCGVTGTLADLALSQAVNSTEAGLFRGIVLSGRQYVNPRLFFDYSYTVQHAQIYGIDDATAMSNPALFNGAQLVGIPLNEASFAADYNNGRGFEARIDSYFVGWNNAYSRPAYGYANGSLSYNFRKTHTALEFSVFNMFNSAVDNYGRFSLGVQPPLNSFNTANPPQPPERFGQLPATYQFVITQRTQ